MRPWRVERRRAFGLGHSVNAEIERGTVKNTKRNGVVEESTDLTVTANASDLLSSAVRLQAARRNASSRIGVGQILDFD
jgi:hypothetical protein